MGAFITTFDHCMYWFPLVQNPVSKHPHQCNCDTSSSSSLVHLSPNLAVLEEILDFSCSTVSVAPACKRTGPASYSLRPFSNAFPICMAWFTHSTSKASIFLTNESSSLEQNLSSFIWGTFPWYLRLGWVPLLHVLSQFCVFFIIINLSTKTKLHYLSFHQKNKSSSF